MQDFKSAWCKKEWRGRAKIRVEIIYQNIYNRQEYHSTPLHAMRPTKR